MRAAAVRFVLAFLIGFLLAPYSGTSSPDHRASSQGNRAEHFPVAGTGVPQGEFATCGTPDRGSEPNGHLRHRDRHRSATVPAPEAPQRSAVAAADGILAPAAFASTGDAHHTSRSSAAHSSTVLQVFRC